MRHLAPTLSAFAVAWLLLADGETWAQAGMPVTCFAHASPTLVYATDPAATGDLTIRCTGGAAGSVASINVLTFLSAPVRSPSPPGLTIDNGAAIAPSIVSGNQIGWTGVALEAPGPNAFRELRLVNAYVDGSALAPGTEVLRNIALSGSSPTQLNNPVMTVARVVDAAFPTPVAEPAPDRDTGPSAFVCTALASVVPIARSEGHTEGTADVVIDCEGGTPRPTDAPIPRADLVIRTSAPLASRVFVDDASEVVLLIDEPPPVDQRPCAKAAAPCPAAGGPGGARNVLQGERIDAHTIRFRGVPIDAPGAGQHRILRIKNIRAAATSVSPGQAIVATIGIAGSSLPVAQSSMNIAFTQSSVTASVTAGVDFGPCGPSPITAIGSTTVSESFAAAWRVRGPGSADPAAFDPGSESGFVNPALGLGTLGLADHGTRLAVALGNVPQGIRIFAEGVATRPNGTIIAELTALGGGPKSAPQSGLVEIPVVGGSAIAYYEIVAADPFAIESARVFMYAAATGALADGTVHASTRYAPSSSEGALDLPRFAPGSPATATLVQVTDPAIPQQCDAPGETYLHVAIATTLGPKFATCWAVFPTTGTATLECAEDSNGRLVLSDGVPMCMEVGG